MKPESWKNKVQAYIQEHKLRKRWMKITASLGALAIIVTAAAMILPAITMENAPQMLECQIDIHTPVSYTHLIATKKSFLPFVFQN